MTDSKAPRGKLGRRVAVGREMSRVAPESKRHRLRGWIWQLLGTAVALSVAVLVLDDISATSAGAVLGAAVVIGIVSALLNPVLARLGVALGWFGVAVLALASEAIVVYIALEITPGISLAGFGAAFLTAIVVGIVTQVLYYAAGVDEQQAYLAEVLRRATRHPVPQPTDGQKGVVFVQMDGVSQPLLEWALLAGNLPTLNRWLRDGTHVSRGWTTKLPSTTPISQAGILHGRTDDMPAFRWYEKDLGRLVVANHPPDAGLIETRLSDGTGLLADGGVSVSNLFSGDAPRALLTMSAIGLKRASGKPRDFVSFFLAPYGFWRTLTRTVGEMVKEKYQGRRQVRNGVEPRISRHGSYIALRGFTNVLQRDLNVVLVAEAMMQGAKSVYVDFLDYDEIAHHAGLGRPESLAAVEGIDRAIGSLESVARYAPREYEFVVLSDHGQSQGATFLQRYGEALEDVVRRLMGGESTAGDLLAATGRDEDWGPVNAFLSSMRTGDDTVVRLGPSSDLDDDQADATERPDVVVAGSGNLGLVWFPRVPGRVPLEDAEQRWPGLVAALAEHPGVSFVMVHSRSRGPVVLGRGGVRVLDTDEVEGLDPLAPFDAHVADDLRRLTAFGNAPDIYLNSQFDPATREVAAFEELVGCHGGTGGWQTKPMLVHPAAWTVDDPELLGAEALHRQLVRWLEALGHRADLADPVRSTP